MYSNNGIIIEDKGLKIGLDSNKGDINFVSHAHSDHLFSSKKQVLSSRETIKLAKVRKRNVGELVEHDQFELIDSGHVLSRGSSDVHHFKGLREGTTKGGNSTGDGGPAQPPLRYAAAAYTDPGGCVGAPRRHRGAAVVMDLRTGLRRNPTAT